MQKRKQPALKDYEHLSMMSFMQAQDQHTHLPVFELPSRDQSGSDSYRLTDGFVEFRPAAGRQWRRLTESDVKLHFMLDTPVGRWLAGLTSIAEVARELAD